MSSRPSLEIEILEPLLLMSASCLGTEGGDMDSVEHAEAESSWLFSADENEGAFEPQSGADTGPLIDVSSGESEIPFFGGERAEYSVESQGCGIYSLKCSGQTEFIADVEKVRFEDGVFDVNELVRADDTAPEAPPLPEPVPEAEAPQAVRTQTLDPDHESFDDPSASQHSHGDPSRASSGSGRSASPQRGSSDDRQTDLAEDDPSVSDKSGSGKSASAKSAKSGSGKSGSDKSPKSGSGKSAKSGSGVRDDGSADDRSASGRSVRRAPVTEDDPSVSDKSGSGKSASAKSAKSGSGKSGSDKSAKSASGKSAKSGSGVRDDASADDRSASGRSVRRAPVTEDDPSVSDKSGSGKSASAKSAKSGSGKSAKSGSGKSAKSARSGSEKSVSGKSQRSVSGHSKNTRSRDAASKTDGSAHSRSRGHSESGQSNSHGSRSRDLSHRQTTVAGVPPWVRLQVCEPRPVLRPIVCYLPPANHGPDAVNDFYSTADNDQAAETERVTFTEANDSPIQLFINEHENRVFDFDVADGTATGEPLEGAVVQGDNSAAMLQWYQADPGEFSGQTVKLPCSAVYRLSPALWPVAVDPVASATEADGRFSITGPDAELFSIDADTGELRFNSSPDFDAPADSDGDNVYQVTLEYSSESATICRTVQIAVCDVEPEAVTTANVPVHGNVLLNDSDPDGDHLEVSLVTPPLNGHLVLTQDGEFDYLPNEGFCGTDVFIYEVHDGNGGCDTAAVYIEVEAPPPQNADPDAVDDSVQTTSAVPVCATVAGNDTDADGDALTWSLREGPLNGCVALASDGSYTYTPDPGFVGTDCFTYQVDDGQGGTDEATVMIRVEPPENTDPLARDDNYTAQQFEPVVEGNVLDNDTDADGDDLAAITMTDVRTSEGGVATLYQDGTFVYHPADGFTGTDTFRYEVTDGNGGCSTAVVQIEVEPMICELPAEPVPEPAPEADPLPEPVPTAATSPTPPVAPAPPEDPETPTDGPPAEPASEPVVEQPPQPEPPTVPDPPAAPEPVDPPIVVEAPPAPEAPAPEPPVETEPVVEAEPIVEVRCTIVDPPPGAPEAISVVEPPTNGTVILQQDGTFQYVPDDSLTPEDRFSYVVEQQSSGSDSNLAHLTSVQVQYDTSYSGNGEGLIWGDPHFVGDDGGLYDVQGEAGHVYNLLSDSGLQVNARFVDWQGQQQDGTVIGELGVVIGTDQLHVRQEGPLLNGTALAPGSSFVTADGSTVEYDGFVTTLTTAEYRLQFVRELGLFSVRIAVLDPFSDTVAPHGLWGQTVDADNEARHGDYYTDNNDFGLQGGGAIEKIGSDGQVTRTTRGDLTSFQLYEAAELFSTTALNPEGSPFFRFDAERGTGLQPL